ncbi:MAG: branched-chain amino acid ABC transporter permease [Acidimicrobiia bacterium]|nr:branched-chain amino acid ABC transporter permease [Acidimicrobiia bacterium]
MAERLLRTTYKRDMALIPNRVQWFWLIVLLAWLFYYPIFIRGLPSPGFWLTIAILVLIAATGALGLNLLSGFAGQISLGHVFFLGVGAFVGGTVNTEAFTTLSGVDFWGLGMPWWVGVLAGGAVAAALGVIVGPAAVRLRGLYLSLVTLALVFLGEWLFTAEALAPVTGAVRGRRVDPVSFDVPVLRDYVTKDGEALYLAALILALVAFLAGKNIARSRVGRAFQATRDRDIAAEVIGVNVTWAKLTAFGVSSFMAGAAGALLGVFLGNPLGSNFGGAAGLLISVEYIAMIVIGGIGTVVGAVFGALFVVALPELIKFASEQGWLPFIAESGAGTLDPAAFSAILFGLFIVVFLILEPLGLFGLWFRLRNYWKGWPFSY